MAHIVFLDDSFPFDGNTLRASALGGVQGATVMLAEALAERGHRVTVAIAGSAGSEGFGVRYRPLGEVAGEAADLAIANRVPSLFDRLGSAARGANRALWLHGPARYLGKSRHLLPLLRWRPVPVFLGTYHAGTRPWGLALRAGPIIPHGIGAPFVDAEPAQAPPPPRAVFTSNPRRGLDWLIALWVRAIRPAVPGAELHVFAGRETYGGQPDAKLEAALRAAAGQAGAGVVLRRPVGKAALVEEFRQARAMLYRGDAGETFCFAAAEAQAMGVPLVTAGVGALAERVCHGVTGFLAPEDAGFATAAVQVLTDDRLWSAQHHAALARRGDGGWDQRAAAWERWFLT
ncbi:MAG: glycosyltransferase [Azospirillum sp.]|nr:glycosyltransferase [Azospirillum sp.]